MLWYGAILAPVCRALNGYTVFADKLMLLLPVFVAVGASCGRAIGSAEYEAPLRSHVFGNVAQYVPLFACFCGCWATAHAFASCLIPESPHYLLGGTCWDDPDDGRVSYTMLRRERFDGGPTKRSSVSEQVFKNNIFYRASARVITRGGKTGRTGQCGYCGWRFRRLFRFPLRV
jgi:hypothetical protein